MWKRKYFLIKLDRNLPGLDAVLDYCKDTTGIRDLEQAAEHLAAHALYMIEVEHATSVSYTADMVNELF